MSLKVLVPVTSLSRVRRRFPSTAHDVSARTLTICAERAGLADRGPDPDRGREASCELWGLLKRPDEDS